MKYLLSITVVVFSLTAYSQINPQNITIARDSFGVPHIYGKTDADAAYGLAWAHSEDDFKNIQYNLLAGKGMLGEVLGKAGVLFDFGLKFLAIDSLVEARYETDISGDFKKVLQGYAQGINDYASAHPKEVLLKKSFPITEKDIIKGYTLEGALLAGVGMALKAIRDNKITEYYSPNDEGSNAFAIAPSRSADNSAWLLINSHQPIEGRFAWYEAHIRSDEGWNIIGGLFPGGVSAFLGTNEYLGWAHTTDYHNFGDIYLLELNPKKNQYLYDGLWRNFSQRKIKLRVKLGFIKLGVKRTVLGTEYGPVFKTKHGWYAIRFPAYNDIRAGEQWFRMNKAKNFQEFEQALKMEALPLFNVIYADRAGNIYFHSGGQIPLRDTTLNWKLPITANTSAYKWKELLPFERKPTLLNPECGYVYNCNQSPRYAAGDSCEWHGCSFAGFQQFVYNRGERFGELLKAHQGVFTWDDLKRIKFDKSYSEHGTYRTKFAALYNLDETKYPDIADAIRKLKKWNLEGTVDNTDAALAMVVHDFLRLQCDCPFALLMIRERAITEEEAVEAIRKAKRFLLKTHGTLEIPLGEVQRHIRGNVNIPASGLREVPRAADAKLYDKKKGVFRIESGDGYIQMAEFSKDNIEIHSVNAYGASAHPENPHYTDQMMMFEKEEFKKMTLDWDSILKTAVRVYPPVSSY